MWQRPHLREPWLPIYVFCVALFHNVLHLYYPPHSDGVVMFDKMAEKIDVILSDYLSASIHVCGNFNVYHEEWLVRSNKTDEEGRYWYDFSITYKLTQIMDESTFAPDLVNCHVNLLDLFLTTCFYKYSSVVLSHFGFSNYSLIKIDVKSKVLFYRAIFGYSKANCDSFRFFIVESSLSTYFKSSVLRMAALISVWILFCIENFILHKNYRLNSQPWYMLKCVAALAHHGHY